MNHLNGNHARLTHPITSDQVLLRMNQITFAEYFASTHCILGEGAVIERLRRSGLELDPYLVNSAFIYEDAKRAAMETICRRYLDIGATTVCRSCCPRRPGGQAGNGSLRPVMPG